MTGCMVNLKELYGVENTLKNGFCAKVTRIPVKIVHELVDNLELRYGADKRYYGNLDQIYEYFKSKYPEEIKKRHVHDYHSLITMAYNNMI